MDDVKSWLSQPCTGSVETSGASWWRLAQKLRPDIRTVVIRRPVPQVVDSFARFGFDRDVVTSAMTRADKKLDQIERRVPNVLSVTFEELGTEAGCAKVFEHCLPWPHDPEWWERLAPLNLQLSMSSMAKYVNAYRPQIEKLAKIAKYQTIAGMMEESKDLEGVTIQVEPFDRFWADAGSLMTESSVVVGESPDYWANHNVEAMRALDKLGALQMVTARSNGKVFGFLMAVVSPSLEQRYQTTATHTAFYANSSFVGLGMKLQRASIAALRARGVGELFLRAGTRGSGPRLGVMYRRLGAENFGQMFKLDL